MFEHQIRKSLFAHNSQLHVFILWHKNIDQLDQLKLSKNLGIMHMLVLHILEAKSINENTLHPSRSPR